MHYYIGLLNLADIGRDLGATYSYYEVRRKLKPNEELFVRRWFADGPKTTDWVWIDCSIAWDNALEGIVPRRDHLECLAVGSWRIATLSIRAHP